MTLGDRGPSTAQHFEGFRFDPRSLELWYDDEKIALKPQPANFLRALLVAAPDFVSREALIGELWPDGTIVEFDQGLNSCARQIRKALADASGHQGEPDHFIETLPRRGYRFVGQLADAAPKAKRSGRLMILIVAILAAIGIAIAVLPRLGDTDDLAIPQANDERDALLQARHGLATGDVAALENARDEYGRLLALSPQNAEARGSGALALALLAGRGDYDWAENTGEAEQRANAVLAEHPDQAEALIALAYVSLYRDWQVDDARNEIDRALAADPERDLALSLAASVYAAAGDSEAAADFADRAALANPQSMSVRSDRCWFHLFNRDPQAALAACRWALELAPESNYARLGLVEAHATLGNEADAARELAALLERNEPHRSLAEYRCALLDHLQRDGQMRSAVLIAATAVQCGDTALALEQLSVAIEAREAGMLFVSVDPRFDPLRSEPAMRPINARLATINGTRN